MFTGKETVNMYMFSYLPFKTELVMDCLINRVEAGKFRVYSERNGEYVQVCQCMIQDRTGHGLSD